MGKKSSFVNVFLAVVAAILLMFAGAFFFWLYQEKVAPKSQVAPTPSVIPLSPTIPQQLPSVEPTKTPTQPLKSDLEGIREAFAKKYSRPASEVNVTVSKNTGTYASGAVSFAGEMGGGWFLAYKGTDGWIVVDDGNGTISCAKIEPYNFPVSIVPECWDETTGKIVYR